MTWVLVAAIWLWLCVGLTVVVGAMCRSGRLEDYARGYDDRRSDLPREHPRRRSGDETMP